MVFGLFGKSDDLTGQQASDNLMVTSITKRPRAIVVIFGHMGANADQMSKYAQLYHDNKCSTICATAPILSLASNDTTMLGEVAITACRETARLIRMSDMSEMGFGRVPVVVHVLGNGGAMVLEELEQRINEIVPKSELKEMMRRTSTPSTPRRNMMKSSSTRSLMKPGSTRQLMKPPLVKSISAPAIKGSMRSILTATSLSDDEEDRDPAQSPVGLEEQSGGRNLNPDNIQELFETKLSVGIPCAVSPTRLKGLSAAPAGVVTTPKRQPSSQCGSPHQLMLSQIPGSPLPQCISPTASEGGSPRQLMVTQIPSSPLRQGINPMASANPLQRRLQRRRRRKLSSPNVKRIDMERSGLAFSAAPRYNSEDRAYHRDMELFASRLVLGSLVFDSAPYFPTIDNEMAAVDALLKGHNPAMKLLAQSAIVGSYGWHGLTRFNYLGGYLPTEENDNLVQGRAGQFLKNMKDIHLSRRHAYIFSQADKICERDQVKNFIKEHKKNGIETIEIELVASRHLQHRKRRCDKYSEFIERVLNSLEGRMTVAQESISEWFDSDDEDGTESGHEIVQQQKEKSNGEYSFVETGQDDKRGILQSLPPS